MKTAVRLLSLISLVSLASCGGGGGSASVGSSAFVCGANCVTNKFIDAPVYGLQYYGSSHVVDNLSTEDIRYTSFQGEFNCNLGETVTFTLNGLVAGAKIGSITCGNNDVFPTDLDTVNGNPRKAQLIALLLHTISEGFNGELLPANQPMRIRREILDFMPYFGDTLNLSDLSGCEDSDDVNASCGYFGIINTIRIEANDRPHFFANTCKVNGSRELLPQYSDDATCSAHTGYAEDSSCLATYPDVPAGHIPLWNEGLCRDYYKGYWGGLGGLSNSDFFALLNDAQVHLEESVMLHENNGQNQNDVPVASLSEITSYIRAHGSIGSFHHNGVTVIGKCYDFSEQHLYLYTGNEGFISATVRACTDNDTDIVSVKRNGLSGSGHDTSLIFAWDTEGTIVNSGVIDLPYQAIGSHQSGGTTTTYHYQELKGSFFKVGNDVHWYQTCNGNHNNFWNSTSSQFSESFVTGTCDAIQSLAWNLQP